MSKKTALITTHFLQSYSGSEMAALDVATTLQGMGYAPQVFAWWADGPLVDDFKKRDIPIITDPAALATLPTPDFIWGQHQFNLSAALANLKDARHAVAMILSPYEPLETPPDYAHQLSLTLFNSAECMERWAPLLPAADKAVFPNSVMPEFLTVADVPASLTRIAVVSNHMPDELGAALPALRAKGITVDHFGQGGNKFERITADVLAPYHAVISIGRTVQYALCLGIPVFCYDRFGGPGWINDANLDRALHYNFAGRCVRNQRDAATLVHEIVTGYAAAHAARTALAQRSHNTFDLRLNLQRVLDACAAKPAIDRKTIVETSLCCQLAPYAARTEPAFHAVGSQHWAMHDKLKQIEAKNAVFEKTFAILNTMPNGNAMLTQALAQIKETN